MIKVNKIKLLTNPLSHLLKLSAIILLETLTDSLDNFDFHILPLDMQRNDLTVSRIICKSLKPTLFASAKSTV